MFEDYSQNMKPFMERNIDQIIDMFEWLKPEDLFIIQSYLMGFVTIQMTLFMGPLHFDIYFILGRNGIFNGTDYPGWVLLLYILFSYVFVPYLYLKAMNIIRKKYNPGYFGQKLEKSFKSRIGNSYHPFKDRFLIDRWGE